MLLKGNCLEALKTLEDNSIDSVVSDPPYELGFMGKSWDNSGIAYSVELWTEVLRVLKPGGHLLAFSGTRTYHRMAVAIEDAGFGIRDSIHWTYGSGFPKSLNLKGEWQGWGTALKPSHEPIVVARKPLQGTVASNVLTWGTGGLNIDGTRVGATVETWPATRSYAPGQMQPGHTGDTQATGEAPAGRWPANTIITHSPGCETECVEGCPVLELDEPAKFFTQTTYTEADWPVFLYYAKASKRERNQGLEGLEARPNHKGNYEGRNLENPKNHLGGLQGGVAQNFHPTVKPVELMRHLIRLVTPKGGTVLDPFLGSGTTAVAAILEGDNWIGCELTEDYWPIIEGRTEWAQEQAGAHDTGKETI